MTRAALGLVIAEVFCLSGCLNLGEGTPPTRYYVLEAMDATAGGPSPELGATDASRPIAVGSVVIPATIDRPQIVTRTESREVVLADFDRWAEPLGSAVSRILCANLSILLGSDNVYSMDSPVRAAPSFRVPLEIVRFDGELEGKATLEAVWAVELVDQTSEPLPSPRVRRTSHPVAVSGKGYDALVVAMSGCLQSLSREIAEEILRVSSESP